MDERSVDDLSSEYIQVRTARERAQKDWEAQDKVFEEKLDALEAQLLDIMNRTNTDSMSTAGAVVMRRVSKSYSTTNWDALYDMVARHKAYALLHKRIHNTNLRQFLEEHPDEYPAGLNVDSRYAVTVRRKQVD
jgi:hypothetical protein